MRPASNSVRRAEAHRGTFVEIEIEIDDAAHDAANRAIDRAFAAIAMVHRRMSFHDPASDVGRINRAPPGHAVEVHPWTYRVLRTALAFGRQSGGAFDISVAATLQRLGVLPADDAEAASPGQPAASCAPIEL